MSILDGASLPGTTTCDLPILDHVEVVNKNFEVSAEVSFLDHVSFGWSCPGNNAEAPVAERIGVLSHRNWLWGAVEDNLSKRQLQVFELRYIYGYSSDDIAKLLGFSERRVVTLILKQCVCKLRKKLGPSLMPLLRGENRDRTAIA